MRIKVNNYYSLGGTGALRYEQTQADIPIVIHPDPKSVFFLGLGTGITAGAALRHPVESVTAVELIPEVVTAARTHFGKYVDGLFEDPRARVIVEDGRHFLQGTDRTYDVIVADLFIPWRSGAASLYTREHFEAVRRRLAPGGLFAQWLPLYQLSRDETMVIARTMLEVFPQVTVWRGDFLPKRPIIAFVAQNEPSPLDTEGLVRNFRKRRKDDGAPRRGIMALTMIFYVGNLSAEHRTLERYVVNTDDWPVIEYSAPITQREKRGKGGVGWFTSQQLADWYHDLATHLPREKDPYLVELDESELDFVRAGQALFQSKTFKTEGRAEEAERFADRFGELVPFEVYKMFQEQK